TTWTGVKRLAAAEKKVADPPRTSSALPDGVSTESSATDPTTSTGIRESKVSATGYPLHSLRSGDSKYRQCIANHNFRSASQRETSPHNLLRLAEHVMLVIPKVRQPGNLREVCDEPLWLERLSCSRNRGRKIGE